MRWLPAALAAAATALRAPSTPRRLTPLRLSPAEVMYEAQRDAMAASAEQEGILFEGHTAPLRAKKLSYSKKTKRRGKKASGFSAPVAAESQAEKDAAARWRSLKRDGILKIEGACAPATASFARWCVPAPKGAPLAMADSCSMRVMPLEP